MASVFLTGGTGRLGRPLAVRLARDGHELHLLVRKESRRGAREWLAALRTEESAVAGRIRLLTGDIARPELLDERDRASVLASADLVVHGGAAVGREVARDLAWLTNVRGTTHVLALAAELPALRRFVHVSDAAVAGDVFGPFGEHELLRNQRFAHPYGESKLIAERRVRASKLPVTIVRPGRVVPVPWLVDAIAVLAEDPAAEGACVHLVDPDDPSTPAVYDVRNAVRLLRPRGLEYADWQGV